jgi:hypothetical protein
VIDVVEEAEVRGAELSAQGDAPGAVVSRAVLMAVSIWEVVTSPGGPLWPWGMPKVKRT